MIRVHC